MFSNLQFILTFIIFLIIFVIVEILLAKDDMKKQSKRAKQNNAFSTKFQISEKQYNDFLRANREIDKALATPRISCKPFGEFLAEGSELLRKDGFKFPKIDI